MLPGGCQLDLGHKMKVSESLGKGVFCPLAPRGMGSVASVLHYSEESDPQWCKAGEKSVFGPLASLELVLWAPPSIIISNLTPGGAGLVMKLLWDDNLTPFSSSKI